MLLREDLDDKQIPCRHKLREGIINQFKKEFAKLKVELSVRFLSFLQKCLLIVSGICGQN